MCEQTVLEQFLHGEIDTGAFHHVDHLRVGFDLLRKHDFLTAAYAFSRGLRAIAARAGKPDAYHETITIAFLSLIAESCATRSFDGFDDFARANPDLMDKKVLEQWYAPERLRSDKARRTFLLPEATR